VLKLFSSLAPIFKSAFKALAAITVASCFALLLCEGFVRLFLPQQLVLVRPDIWQSDSVSGWKQAPFINTEVNTGERSVHLYTDKHGHRVGAEPTNTANNTTAKQQVLVIGDSYVAALQVEYADTFVSQLETLGNEDPALTSHTPLQLVNTGVGAWGPSHYRIKLRQQLDRNDYAAVLVFFFLGNDLEYKSLDRFEPRRPMVHELRAPNSFSKAELIDAVLYPLNDLLEVNSQLFVLFKKRAKSILMRAGLTPVTVPEELLTTTAQSPRWDLMADICADMAKIGRAHETPLKFVLLPANYMVDPELLHATVRNFDLSAESFDIDQASHIMSKALSERDVDFVDLTEAFRETFATGTQALYGEVDPHFTQQGHRLVAESIAPLLTQMIKPDS